MQCFFVASSRHNGLLRSHVSEHFGTLWEMNNIPYPNDVSDKEWSFVTPYLTLMTEDAPQRERKCLMVCCCCLLNVPPGNFGTLARSKEGADGEDQVEGAEEEALKPGGFTIEADQGVEEGDEGEE